MHKIIAFILLVVALGPADAYVLDQSGRADSLRIPKGKVWLTAMTRQDTTFHNDAMVIPVFSSAPSTAVWMKGGFYYNSTDGQVYVTDGVTWGGLASAGAFVPTSRQVLSGVGTKGGGPLSGDVTIEFDCSEAIGAASSASCSGELIVFDADLDDLADGSLTGSKVGTGISASNVTTGTLPNTVLDVELSSIAGVTSAADRLPYYTGLGTATVTVFTAAGRALIDDADAAAQRTTLGLAIGTNVQAWDADLDDLADGSLTGSKVGTGISASNVTTGTLPNTVLDVELSSIAGVTSAADRLPYYTGLGTATVTVFTTAGRALIDDADAAAQRTTLGLVIGTDVQAQDAELAAIAGLVSAADRLPYFTGLGTATLATFTTAGRALIDDADASAQRTTLGLGTIATQASNAVSITGGSVTGITDITVADGGTGSSTAAGARTALGLVIGTDVQAQDAELAAIAGLVSAADRLPYFTGLGTATLATFTTAGRALIDDADAPAQRATLGLGTLATSSSISDLDWSGADLAVVNGGTGASDAATAATNLGLGAASSVTFGAVTVDNTIINNDDIFTKADNGDIVVGASDDFTFSHTGTVSLIHNIVNNNAWIVIDNSSHGEGVRFDAENDAGTNVTMMTLDPDGSSTLTEAGTIKLTTASTGINITGSLGVTDAATTRTNLGLVIGTDVQAQDAELAALAGLTSAADRLPYFTGLGTAALAVFTVAGRALVDDASAAAQRTTLGLVIGTDVQAQDAELAAIAGLASVADRLPYFTGTGTAALATFTAAGRALVDDADAAAQRTTLGLVIGTNVQAFDAELAALAGLVSTADRVPYFTGSGTASLAVFTAAGRAIVDDADAAAQRTTLGLGTIATQAANSVSITGGSVTGITDVLVADGGTGSSTAAGARTNLGLVIGTDVQAQDAELAAIAGLVSAADRLPYFTGLGTATLATFTAAGRALIDDADAAAQRTTLGLVIGTNVQAQDAELAAIAGLVSAADRLPYFTGLGTATLATFTTAGRALIDDADAAAQRTTLGLGTIATQASNAVSITGGSVTGITDVTVADGGTGSSTAGGAATNLGLGTASSVTFGALTVDNTTLDVNDLQTNSDTGELYVGASDDFIFQHNATISTVHNQLDNASWIVIDNSSHGEGVRFDAENDAGTNVTMMTLDPDGASTLTNAGNVKLTTETTGIAITGTASGSDPVQVDDFVTLQYLQAQAGGGATKSDVFTTNGTWTKPADVSFVWVTACGGGGGAGGGRGKNIGCDNFQGGGGGGGAGECIINFPLKVTGNITVTVGAGGIGGTGGGNNINGNPGTSGGTTTFDYISVKPGLLGTGGTGGDGGTGGNGGGQLANFGIGGPGGTSTTSGTVGGSFDGNFTLTIGGSGGGGGALKLAGAGGSHINSNPGGTGGGQGGTLCGGGGGGAASFFGNGGNGAPGGAGNGVSPAAGSYGAGGGGGAGKTTTGTNGADGATGVVIVSYVAP